MFKYAILARRKDEKGIRKIKARYKNAILTQSNLHIRIARQS
jgi:hypothetical protein